MHEPSHSSRLVPASGFHPKLLTEIVKLQPLGWRSQYKAGTSDGSAESSTSSTSSDVASSSSCSLHLLYHLSSSIILDQYQLRQVHNEGRLVTSRLSNDGSNEPNSKGKGRAPRMPVASELELGGQLDLEAPVSQIDADSVAVALITIPMDTRALPSGFQIPSVDVTVELPLHLRYQEPVLSRWLSADGRNGHGGHWWSKHSRSENRSDIKQVPVSWPCVFWACETEQSEAMQPGSPYRLMSDASSCVGYVPQELRDSVSTSSPMHPQTTKPYHYLLRIHSAQSAHQVKAGLNDEGGTSIAYVPTGVLGDAKIVHVVNLCVTWIGFLLIAYKAYTTSQKWRRQQHQARYIADQKQEGIKQE
ncbi:hypothetical protein EMMF5_004405 [Cystobasidiomycetes sp. EMM_F5]